MTEKKTEKLLSKVAEQIVKHNVNSACWWYLYQPPLSEKIIKRVKR